MKKNHFSQSKLLVFVLSCSCLLGLLGCGPRSRVPINYVEGVVAVDGIPRKGVSVVFIPTDTEAGYEGAAGMTNDEGVFRVTSLNGLPEKGAMEGEFAVVFYLNEMKQFDRPVYDVTRAEWVREKMVNVVPVAYQDEKTTPVKAIVQKGKNRFQFDINTK
jgi:hypothetical protein